MAIARIKMVQGERYGSLVFIQMVKIQQNDKTFRRMGQFQCDCGNVKLIRVDQVLGGNNRSCGCNSPAKNHKKYLEEYGDDYCFYVLWKYAMKNACHRKIPYEITLYDIKSLYEKQNGKCAYTQFELTIPKGFTSITDTTTASIDRIDSTKPYCVDNIQLVTKAVNFMKLSMSHDEFIEICKLIAKNATPGF